MSYIPETIPINEVHLILGGEPISFIGLDFKIPSEAEKTWGSIKGTKWGPMSEETKQLMRENHTRYWQGKTLSPEHREKIRQTKMKEPQLTCSSCGKTMNKPNFVKYGHSLKYS